MERVHERKMDFSRANPDPKGLRHQLESKEGQF